MIKGKKSLKNVVACSAQICISKKSKLRAGFCIQFKFNKQVCA
jgi:hypothetical protein